jgi:protein-tyrosine phosphatase
MTAELYWLPDKWPGRLAIAPRPRGGDWLDDEMVPWKLAGANVVLSLLTPDELAHFELGDEQRAAVLQGIEFISFPIVDRDVPDSIEGVAGVAAKLASDLRAGRNVVAHCRQGIGRSAVLAAAVLILLDVPPEAAIQQISLARRCPVPETAEQKQWIANFARRHIAPLASKSPIDPALTIGENSTRDPSLA